jgi:hypothetical protein
MKKQLWSLLAAVSVLAALAIFVIPASAQMAEVKEKPPMYSYVSNWTISRAQWGDMAKNSAADQPMLDKAIGNGTLVGYGDDYTLVHQRDQETHDSWWSSMSMGGLMKVLEQFYATGASTTPVLGNATKHWDEIYVSRYYNWHPGSWKGVYTHGGTYKLKADAPDDAVDILSKNLFVPFFEKLLADGSIHEYEVDTQAVHTEAPGLISVIYIAANADALDKVDAALRQWIKNNPLGGPALGSMIDFTAHRDILLRSNATFK